MDSKQPLSRPAVATLATQSKNLKFSQIIMITMRRIPGTKSKNMVVEKVAAKAAEEAALVPAMMRTPCAATVAMGAMTKAVAKEIAAQVVAAKAKEKKAAAKTEGKQGVAVLRRSALEAMMMMETIGPRLDACENHEQDLAVPAWMHTPRAHSEYCLMDRDLPIISYIDEEAWHEA